MNRNIIIGVAGAIALGAKLHWLDEVDGHAYAGIARIYAIIHAE